MKRQNKVFRGRAEQKMKSGLLVAMVCSFLAGGMLEAESIVLRKPVYPSQPFQTLNTGKLETRCGDKGKSNALTTVEFAYENCQSRYYSYQLSAAGFYGGAHNGTGDGYSVDQRLVKGYAVQDYMVTYIVEEDGKLVADVDTPQVPVGDPYIDLKKEENTNTKSCTAHNE